MLLVLVLKNIESSQLRIQRSHMSMQSVDGGDGLDPMSVLGTTFSGLLLMIKPRIMITPEWEIESWQYLPTIKTSTMLLHTPIQT